MQHKTKGFARVVKEGLALCATTLMDDEGYKVVQDWQDYDKSLISTLGEKYYKKQGIKAYSRTIQKFIPNEISNCFPHALSLAKILEKIVNDKKTDKVKVLDLGCGSGIFAKHLLIAIKELGFLDKVELIVADYSKQVLKDIKSLKILDGFKNYTLVEVNALELNTAKTLDGKSFDINNLDLVIMNYLYDALPTKILRPDKNKKLEKLQFRLLQEDNESAIDEIDDKMICEDLNLINKLLIDARWVEYKPKEEAQIEQEYFDFVKDEPVNPLGEVIYNYGVLKVTETLLDLLSPEGLIYSADMPNRFDSQSSFTLYGNAAAHDINESLIINTFIKKGVEIFFHRDTLLNHYFFSKTQAAMIRQEKPIKENFVSSSKTDIFVDLKQALNAINSPYSKDIFRMLVQELVKIDTHSCFSKVAQAQDLLNFGNDTEAKELFAEAQKIDFLGDFNLKAKI
jgi:ubiquinone/menaquinone biosynthesis C-methylase UbiE